MLVRKHSYKVNGNQGPTGKAPIGQVPGPPRLTPSPVHCHPFTLQMNQSSTLGEGGGDDTEVVKDSCKTDPATKLGDLVLHFGATNLPSADKASKSDPFMVLFKVSGSHVTSTERGQWCLPFFGTDGSDQGQPGSKVEGAEGGG